MSLLDIHFRMMKKTAFFSNPPLMRINIPAKITPPDKLVLSILPFKNHFIFYKTRQNQRLDAKHYSVTDYGVFS